MARDERLGLGAGLTEAGRDFIRLVIDYVKQETLEPLQSLGRFLLFGLIASMAITAGVFLLLLALLRALQTETSAFTGNLSWLPYLIVAVAAIGVMGLAAWRITKGPGTQLHHPNPTGPAATVEKGS